MTRLSLLGNAKADFDTAFGWYCERSEAAAIRFMEATVESLTAVSQDPHQFAQLDEIHRQSRIKRFPYHIVFRVDGDRIFVVAIAHHSRRPDYWRPPSNP